MKIRKHGINYNFLGETATGLTMRWGATLHDNPVCAPWPELADISISNHCTKGCEFCYKDSSDNHEFMSAKEYADVLYALTSPRWGSVFQVALGGGEPLEHPEFEKIIRISNEREIIVNFTTNGLHLDSATVKMFRGRVGAVAISAGSVSDIDQHKIKILLDAGIKTNLHFVLSNNSICEAIDILKGKYDNLLKGLNSVIFLTYKPKGRASTGNCLAKDENLLAFLSLVNKGTCGVHVGFDACFVPPLMHYTDVNVDYIDACECGFFSVYVDEKLNVKPCSFSNNNRYSFSLRDYSVEDIWQNKFEAYRNEILGNSCKAECVNASNCRGRCLYFDELSLCFKDKAV